jgi:hypothetical protein
MPHLSIITSVSNIDMGTLPDARVLFLADSRMATFPATLLRLLLLPVTLLIAIASYVVAWARSRLRTGPPPAASSAISSTHSAPRGASAHPKSTPLLDLLADDDEDDAPPAPDQLRRGVGGAGVAQRRFEWIGDADLEWFKGRVAPVEDRLLEGGRIGDGWQEMMNKHIPGEVSCLGKLAGCSLRGDWIWDAPASQRGGRAGALTAAGASMAPRQRGPLRVRGNPAPARPSLTCIGLHYNTSLATSLATSPDARMRVSSARHPPTRCTPQPTPTTSNL